MPFERWERVWHIVLWSGLAAAIAFGMRAPAGDESRKEEPLAQATDELSEVSPDAPDESTQPDAGVIWIEFSHGDIGYTAVHVFERNYILLSSRAKDRDDFAVVYAKAAEAFGSESADEISDRGDDICATIDVPQPFSRAALDEMVVSFYGAGEFSNARVTKAFPP